MFTRKEKFYKIQDLKNIGDYVKVEGGRRQFGAQHVLIKHYGTNIGPVTADEILQIGDIVRSGKVEFESNARVYTRPAEDGATLKVVVGKSTKDGSDTLITFHSKNRKAPTRATRESSALQGASQKAETSATSNISKTEGEVKEPATKSGRNAAKNQPLYSEVFPGARLVAKYGQKVATAAWKLFKKGAAKFATWAREMSKKFGKAIHSKLRSIWADMGAFNKQLGRSGAVGDKFRDVERSMPNDNVSPRRIDPKAKDAVQQVAAEFKSWPNTITAADGNKVLLHNPEGGSLAQRVFHLIRNDKTKQVEARKIEWVSNVPSTIENATVRLSDDQTGNKLYVRGYRGGEKHVVVVRPDGSIFSQGIFDGNLITQFQYDSKGRQRNMRVEWENPAKVRAAGTVNATVSNSAEGVVASKSDNGSESLDLKDKREPAATINDNPSAKKVKKDKLYSIENAVAEFASEYASKGLKQSAEVIRAGVKLMRSGVTQFAQWARKMFNQFGAGVKKHLRSMFKELGAFNKRLGRTGAISGRPSSIIKSQVVLKSVSEMTDADFTNPTRSIVLPSLPDSTLKIIGSEKKPVLIKQNILEKNRGHHKELTPEDSRRILNAALYAHDLIGKGKAKTKPSYWIAVKTGNKNSVVVVDATETKYGHEIVGWREVSDRGFEQMKRQAEVEGGQFLITESKAQGAAGLSALPSDLSSTTKDTPSAKNVKSGDNKLEKKEFAKARDFEWRKVDKDTYLLELTDPNSGKSVVVETIRRPKGTDNVWQVDNWNTFGAKDSEAGSFTSLKEARATIKNHAKESFNQKTYRENAVIKDRIKDAKTAKAREKAIEADKARDKREAKQAAKKKKEAEDYQAEGKNKPVEAEPDKPKTWKEKAKHFVEKAEEIFFDAWAPVRRLQESIKKTLGVAELSEDIDLYQKLEVVSGKIESGTRIFKEKYFEPVKKYLISDKIAPKSFDRFLAIMHAEERNNAVASKNELFSLTDAPGSGISTEQAQKEIQEHKDNGTFDKYMKAAEMTYKLNNLLLDEQVKYGLLSQKQRDAYRKYQYYTPMKSPPDQGFILDKPALGRRSEATNQLSYIEKAIEVVFRRGERKQVIDTAMNLFSIHKSPKMYKEVKPGKVQYLNKRTGKVGLRTDTSKIYNNPNLI